MFITIRPLILVRVYASVSNIPFGTRIVTNKANLHLRVLIFHETHLLLESNFTVQKRAKRKLEYFLEQLRSTWEGGGGKRGKIRLFYDAAQLL